MEEAMFGSCLFPAARIAVLLAAHFFFALDTPCGAATINSVWKTGTGSSDWNVASNWTPALVPNNNGNVFNVNVVGAFFARPRIFDFNVTINNLTMDDAGVILEGPSQSLTVNGNLMMRPGSGFSGQLNLSGSSRVAVTGNLTMDNGSTLTINTGSSMDVAGSMRTVGGIHNIDQSATLTVGGGNVSGNVGFVPSNWFAPGFAGHGGTLVIRNSDMTFDGAIDLLGTDISGLGSSSRLINAPGSTMTVVASDIGSDLHFVNQGTFRAGDIPYQ